MRYNRDPQSLWNSQIRNLFAGAPRTFASSLHTTRCSSLVTFANSTAMLRRYGTNLDSWHDRVQQHIILSCVVNKQWNANMPGNRMSVLLHKPLALQNTWVVLKVNPTCCPGCLVCYSEQTAIIRVPGDKGPVCSLWGTKWIFNCYFHEHIGHRCASRSVHWGLYWTRGSGTGFTLGTLVFPCQYYSTSAPHDAPTRKTNGRSLEPSIKQCSFGNRGS